MTALFLRPLALLARKYLGMSIRLNVTNYGVELVSYLIFLGIKDVTRKKKKRKEKE